MKITITGSLGNNSKPLTEKLVAAGHDVTVVSSSADKVDAITALGAKAAIGSVDDVAFLTKAFAGADAVYTMVPPNFVTSAWKQYIAGIGANYVAAIKAAGVKHVVNLSSIGAHLPDGVGPVSGMHFVEQQLNELEGVHVLNLRPGFFYTNYYNSIGLIKDMGIVGGNYGADVKQVSVDPRDIADAVFNGLTDASFTGKAVSYVVSGIYDGNEVARILGKAFAKPDLRWVEFKDEDLLQNMLKIGASEDVAKNYVEMGVAARTGIMYEDYYHADSVVQGKIGFKTFAEEYAKRN